MTDDTSLNGFCVKLLNPDHTKSSYGEILESINGIPVKSVQFLFNQCTNLKSSPIIPSNVTNMSATFYGCTSLVTAPIIPSNVTNMSATFYGCTSLVTAPTIPSSVTSMFWTFTGCSSLTGEIEINANLIGENIRDCGTFSETTKEIKITGTTTRKAELAQTSDNGNINY